MLFTNGMRLSNVSLVSRNLQHMLLKNLSIIKHVSTQAESGKEATVSSSKLPQSDSFSMNIFKGELNTSRIFPFPEVLCAEKADNLKAMIDPIEKFMQTEFKPAEYDNKEQFDPAILGKLADLGAYGLMVPEELHGSGLCNTEYARLVNIIGKYDLTVGVHLGAHQSIGYKGILIYGTDAQKQKYVPDLATGKKIAAYCLTEPDTGSDASSIQTKAELSADGKHYILNGTKVWITNGGMADIFTVFARTPVKGKTGDIESKITAFIVDRKFGGVTHGEPEKKMGIKASNTVSVYFEDCKVPVENVLGEVGQGFKIAVNILNQGRFGMAAALSGTMQTAIHQATQHALQRKQFGRKLHEFGNIQEKIANMVLRHYTTESMAFILSGMMDLGATDYQVEAAISKIYSSESAWYCVDEAIQILGGIGYMRYANLERFLRDLRIFRIFEGANDILRLFVSLTGLNYAGKHLNAASKSPTGMLNLAMQKMTRSVGIPGKGRSLQSHVPSDLQASAALVGDAIDSFGGASTDLIVRYKKAVMEEQFRLTRLADAAIQLFGMVSNLSRASLAIKNNSDSADHEIKIVKMACNQGVKLVERSLSELGTKADASSYDYAKSVSRDVFTHGGVFSATPLGF